MRTILGTIAQLLTVAVACLGVACLECPNHCFCYEWEGLARTDCIRRNLINTFLGISYKTQILDLSHNVISILHGNEFSDANLRQLQDLKLSNNRLHKIDKFSFNGLHLLTHLDLSFNSIEYLNPFTFRFNPNLKTLNVSFNPLSLRADEPFLSAAPSVQVLDLSSCRFDFVGPRTFSDLNGLRVLNISRNRVRKLQLAEKLETLKYLDVTGNEIPCNDQTYALLHSLQARKIQFRAFCETSQKVQMIPVATESEEEKNGTEVSLFDRGENENRMRHVPQHRSLLNDVSMFLQSIPSFYAIICGIQLGVFIGSFSTYICMRKSRKHSGDEQRGTAESRGYRHREFDNLSSALIPLNTPPGTPPSPYHSRFFPSSFSLSPT